MGDERSREHVRISPVDCRGRTIAPEVLPVANQISGRALAYGEKLLCDPAVALSAFEESAAAVSKVVVRERNHGHSIQNLQAYLFQTFMRRVNRLRRKELLFNARVSNRAERSEESNVFERLELEILIHEVMNKCDDVTQDMFYQRIQGFSWKEIGQKYATSAHAAESRFSHALQRLRKELNCIIRPHVGK